MRSGERKLVARLSHADFKRALERYVQAECIDFFEVEGETLDAGAIEVFMSLSLDGAGLQAEAYFRKSK